jgi:hypothetical protein
MRLNRLHHRRAQENDPPPRLPCRGINASIKALRQLCAITLLAVFGLPFASVLFALASKHEAQLPACCRRAGMHHCAENTTGGLQAAVSQTGLRSSQPACPYYPASLRISQHSDSGLTAAAASFAAIVSHPAAQAQTQTKWRIARDRSRNKRGPPFLSLV